jgi:hypothetical protein
MFTYTSRFICPHCHAPVDPGRLEAAADGFAEYRVCPECDEAIAYSGMNAADDQGAARSSFRSPWAFSETCSP